MLRREGYEVLLAENGKMALAALARGAVDLLISDIKMPDMSGVEVLRNAKQIDPALPAIMMTAFASTETAVEAMRLGACDYLVKPFDVDELKLKVREKLESRATAAGEPAAQARAQRAARLCRHHRPQLADAGRLRPGGVGGRARRAPCSSRASPAPARNWWRARCISSRCGAIVRLSRINCGALTETLLESELFGHMKGSFTGADATKKGLIEGAEGGTIFLDEIGETTPMMQVKLLRVLQERKFRRVGGLEEIEADIRVVAATNQDLPKMVAEGRFREDLFYRINVIPIQLPPLRDRREDIPLIAEHFLAKYRQEMGKSIETISG